MPSDPLRPSRRRGRGRRRGRRRPLHGLLAARSFDRRALDDHPWLLSRGRPARRTAGAHRPAFDCDGGLLEPVGAHRTQPGIGDELAALFVLVVAVHEGVFLALPVKALEPVRDIVLALLAEHAFHVVGDPRRDQAIGHRTAGRIHVALC